jgi:hypothetical protein
LCASDAIHAPAVDRTVASIILLFLKTRVQMQQAKAFCERVKGTMRRECLDGLSGTPEGVTPRRTLIVVRSGVRGRMRPNGD